MGLGKTRTARWAVAAITAAALAAAGSTQVGKLKLPGIRPGQRVLELKPLTPPSPEAVIPGVPPPVRRSMADAHVSTKEQLFAAIAGGKKVIWIEDGASIDMTMSGPSPVGGFRTIAVLPDGVTIAGGRSDTNPGPLLYQTKREEEQRFLFQMGNRCRITGLRLRGPTHTTEAAGDETGAIHIAGVADVIVDRCEMFSWPGSCVKVTAATNPRTQPDRVRVTLNFMHHNVRCGRGYGVVIGGTSGCTRIDRNVFNWNRHHVAANGEPGQSYIADLNLALSGGPKCEGALGTTYYNQHFDIHGRGDDGYGGVAGDFIDIHHNSIRGDQGYYLVKTRPAFWLRGTPREAAYFRDNVVAHNDSGAAVRNEKNASNMIIRNNWYNVDTSFELAVGDFDGDGKQDVFQATGGVWVFSPMGQREWRYLNHQPFRHKDLRFGDFDGNGKTDVFLLSTSGWKWSKDAVAPFTNLPAHYPLPPSGYRFGDFDGDRKTDLFVSDSRGQWKFSSACASAFQDLNSSRLSINELRFADFDGNGKTDVFSLSGNQWSVAYDARSGWQRLNSQLSDKLSELVFADFDGDKRCDIGRQDGASWQVSWGGRTRWQTLANDRYYYRFNTMLLGDFNGDGKADALSYSVAPKIGGIGIGSQPALAPGYEFVMASMGSGRIVRRSLEDMR